MGGGVDFADSRFGEKSQNYILRLGYPGRYQGKRMLGRRSNHLSQGGTGDHLAHGKRRSSEPQHFNIREPFVGFVLVMGSLDGNALGGGGRRVRRIGVKERGAGT